MNFVIMTVSVTRGPVWETYICGEEPIYFSHYLDGKNTEGPQKHVYAWKQTDTDCFCAQTCCEQSS